MATHKVLIGGQWIDSDSTGTFQAINPRTRETINEDFPISSWNELSNALRESVKAFSELRSVPPEATADFLEKYAERLDARSEEIRQLAHEETALPFDTRLVGELGRTTGQLRQAANAARNRSWCQPIIDTQNNIRSCYAAVGPVAVFGPNNFPLAFGSVSGGDFAAAIAAGNPVIAKAHPLHPGTTRMLAEAAQAAAVESGMPDGTVQLVYQMDFADGEKFVKDDRLAAVAFTGSRNGGLKLKTAADSVGKPIYLELSSVNPVVILPGALAERADDIAEELTGSCLMGSGQFCTNPGMVLIEKGEAADSFVVDLVERFKAAPVGTLFSESGQRGLDSSISTLVSSGAELLCGGTENGGEGFSHSNTVLKVSADSFLNNAEQLQTEAFGSSTLVVVYSSTTQANEVLESLEGNLTGCVYSATDGSDDASYDELAPTLRQRVGRLINDKMPTGVAVSPAMNHGGPFPATGHAGFTSVGIPGSMLRFAMLQCFDNVRPHRLPDVLKDENALSIWRQVDGEWRNS